jgi:hypothetical protein
MQPPVADRYRYRRPMAPKPLVILTTDENTATWYHTHQRQCIISNTSLSLSSSGTTTPQWPDHYLSLTNLGLASPTRAELNLQVAYLMPVSLLRLTALPSSMNALDGPAGGALYGIVAIGSLGRESRQR